MLEQIILHRQPETGAAIDVGLLAESLLFFQKTTVLLDYGNAVSLIKSIGPDLFFELIEHGFIDAIYSPNMMGTHTNTISDVSEHSVVFYSLFGDKKPKAGRRDRTQIEAMLERAGVPRFRMRETYERFSKLVKTKKLSEIAQEQNNNQNFVRSDSLSKALFQGAANEVINHFAPSYHNSYPFNFEVVGNDKKFFILQDIDYESLNQEIARYGPIKDVELTPASVVQNIFSSQLDMVIGAYYGFDITTSELTRKVNENRLNSLYRRVSRNLDVPPLFQQKVFGNIGSVRETINSGEKTFDEFMPLLEKSTEFKKWLADLEPEDNLFEAYCSEVTRQSWADRLPSKQIRFGLSSGLGVLADAVLTSGIGTSVGLGLGALDTFVIDRMLKGWRPDTFVSKVQGFIED